MHINVTEYNNRVRWTCKPCSDKEDTTWKVKPGILLKAKNGKNSSVTVKSYVSYFRMTGGVRTYTMKDTVSCGITFKNHRKA